MQHPLAFDVVVFYGFFPLEIFLVITTKISKTLKKTKNGTI